MAEATQTTNFKDDHYFQLTWPRKRVVIKRGDTVLADSDQAAILQERAKQHGLLPPLHYFPREAVRMAYLQPLEDYTTHCPIKGDTTYYDVVVNGETLKKAAWTYDKPLVDSEPIRDYICFDEKRFTVESLPPH
jgi:uncharacterized protein (DUF427 family)